MGQFPLSKFMLCVCAAGASYVAEAGISPTKLEVNLGPLPFDVYSSSASLGQYNIYPWGWPARSRMQPVR